MFVDESFGCIPTFYYFCIVLKLVKMTVFIFKSCISDVFNSYIQLTFPKTIYIDKHVFFVVFFPPGVLS